VKVGTLVDGAYEFETFTGQDAMASGRSQTIVSPSFPALKVTAIEVLKAGRRWCFPCMGIPIDPYATKG
jgi:hypothetical protein